MAKYNIMRRFMNITKALADENRVRIVAALKGHELCVCQLIELLELAPSTVSKHLFILRNAGLIANRKQGRWMYYRLAGDEEPAEIEDSLSWVFRSIGKNTRIVEDNLRLQEILKNDPEVLCSRQTSSGKCESTK